MNSSFIDSVATLVGLEGPERASIFAAVLERGEIHATSSTGALQIHLGLTQARLRPYRDALSAAPTVAELVLALRAAAETAARIAATQPTIEVAWTYPGNARPGLRTTGGVAREIVDDSRSSLLVVGYSVTLDPTLTGLAAQTIDAIARAGARGVIVTAVLHSEVNRHALLRAWRPGVRPPAIFKWLASDDDPKSAVHAKVLISDRRDGLVTSANLTYHGFEANIEMGIRIKGPPAAEIHDRIHELITAGELVPWID
jgi:phosphatidylserine/phosphatidylglycerophosphate/cardiolipin synthase-like enzyme